MDFLVQQVLENENEDKKQIEMSNKVKIYIVGCGGAGNNSLSRLYELGVKGATCIALNTDQQHLSVIKADKKLLIGKELTQGRGAGGYPEIGRQAAEESKHSIKELLENPDIVFITAGLGGGTGTGSAPVVAEIARETGAIVIAVVTMPFRLEKARRMKAELGLYELKKYADTVIVIENNRLVEIAGNLPLTQAFLVADELIATMIKGIIDTIAIDSIVNLDYADLRAVMKDGGVSLVGVGESNSEHKAKEAVEKALTNKLLDIDYKGATGALIHITGGPDMTLEEANLIGDVVSASMDPQATVIWGTRVDEDMEGRIRVMVVLTGLKSDYFARLEAQFEEKKPEQELAYGVEVIRKK